MPRRAKTGKASFNNIHDRIPQVKSSGGCFHHGVERLVPKDTRLWSGKHLSMSINVENDVISTMERNGSKALKN